MWDSAKKPIKIRSVLQSNGMRHFLVNEESEELYMSYVLQQQKKNKQVAKKERESEWNRGNNGNNILRRSNSLNEWNSENSEEFFGVAGSKISNSRKHFSQRYPPLVERKDKQGIFDFGVRECPGWKGQVLDLDLVPVKSPVIKKLICGSKRGSGGMELKSRKETNTGSTTLCSRIMTWIDLEVKRNAGKGRSSGMPFSTADLDIVNGLGMPSCESESVSSSSSESSSSYGDTSSTEESGTSSVTLPKLVPCWRKEREEGGSRAKKSVRISEDLPKWGKMKHRLRRKDRSGSLDELFGDRDANDNLMTLQDIRIGKSMSTLDMSSGMLEEKVEKEEKETDTFLICDEKMGTGSRLHVHIFLPQTDTSTTAPVSGTLALNGKQERTEPIGLLDSS